MRTHFFFPKTELPPQKKEVKHSTIRLPCLDPPTKKRGELVALWALETLCMFCNTGLSWLQHPNGVIQSLKSPLLSEQTLVLLAMTVPETKWIQNLPTKNVLHWNGYKISVASCRKKDVLDDPSQHGFAQFPPSQCGAPQALKILEEWPGDWEICPNILKTRSIQ